ncbi:MAG: amidohydrolase family protein [Pseudomonadales bacterium]|jgi:predicted TIM-barrel fold metal-dependent hydrolase|nr:amidohydrolase family protein [Pseudomonadales bacterium]MDP7597469.1 amidohydrolase family protein [Pseudomonadales bacterium]HJN49219.1 amidohydrolase family protein [Pseudomonadales bacterium]|tara:strand:- start:6698 stop:7702 length:1005 start_codon:yes stop_codon:yes gene_type:complete
MPTPGSAEWLASVTEESVEPERAIIDTHHHLWKTAGMWGTYELDDLWADTGSGHNVEKTVFIDCHSNYRQDGPSHLKPIGETEYVTGVAEQSAKQAGRATIAGIVSFANMTLGEAVEEVLQAHEEAGSGLFRGIRHAGPHDTTGTLTNPGTSHPCPYSREDFRLGVRTLGNLGYTYDTWHFFHQNQDYLALARAVPDTTMILDHFGSPLGVGAYAGKQDEIFEQWQKDVKEIAGCPNVIAKLGGLAMPDNGFGWDRNDTPPTSDDFAEAQRRYYLHMIACFGPERCMFESNFPVDKLSISYQVLWNGMKKIVSDFSDSEKHAMFYGTAAQVYRL